MKTSESIASIAPAIVKAAAAFSKVGKSGKNTYDKYDYANLDDYLSVAKPIMAEHGLCIITSAPELQIIEGGRQTSKGKPENAVTVRITLTLLHESGEWVAVEAWGEGQDRADKSTYKATTGARKYGVAMILGLVTTDDPEGDNNVGGVGEDDAPDPSEDTPSDIEELI